MGEGLPELKKSELDEIVELYKNVYQPAVKINGARVRKHPNKINNIIISEWSQRSLERGTSFKICRSMLTDSSLKTSIDIDTVDISHWALNALSKSEKFKAVIHTPPSDGQKGGSKYYLEIWSSGKSTAVYDLAALDIHGPVYTDDTFGTLSWSDQEDKVLYVAEIKSPKTSPFYQQKSKSESKDDKNEETGMGDQFIYEEDWGEILSPKKQPVIVVCDILKKNISIIEGISRDFSPGQAIWEPSGNGIVGVAVNNEPRRLGLVYCTNRKSHIFYLNLAEKYEILSDVSLAAHSPRFSPNGKCLVWLQRPFYGAHHGAHALVKYDWNEKKFSVLVDIVNDSCLTKNGKEFFGIFCGSLTTRCWTSDSKYLILSTAQKYRINTYAINIEDGSIYDIGSTNEYESTILLDVSEDDYALCNTTSFKLPSVLSSLHIPTAINSSTDEPFWVPLTKPFDVVDKNMISNFTVYDETKKNESCYATYYGPQSDNFESVPLILYPHGGPHSSVPSAFSLAFHLFTKLGFGILIVHFHGSTGNGQNYVDSLLGKIGSLDVEDCYAALQTALKKFQWLDSKQVVLFGGSHGGFLVTHLSARYPNDFKAIVARNPVTDLNLGLFTSDIPDWSLVEAGFSYEGLVNTVGSSEVSSKMAEISPMTYIKNVKTPTLLLLGKKDLRVPASQGLVYYHILKEMNVPTKLLYYEDNHSLSTVPVEMDSIINSIIWFKRCLKHAVKLNSSYLQNIY